MYCASKNNQPKLFDSILLAHTGIGGPLTAASTGKMCAASP